MSNYKIDLLLEADDDITLPVRCLWLNVALYQYWNPCVLFPMILQFPMLTVCAKWRRSSLSYTFACTGSSEYGIVTFRLTCWILHSLVVIRNDFQFISICRTPQTFFVPLPHVLTLSCIFNQQTMTSTIPWHEFPWVIPLPLSEY